VARTDFRVVEATLSSNKSMRVSHEIIYRSLFIQSRGVLKKELVQHLQSERLMRRFVHARAVESLMVRSSMPFPLAVLAFLCLPDGFLFMDSWHRHGKSTFMFGMIFSLSGLLMLVSMSLLKKR
jgi:hypothetical protein